MYRCTLSEFSPKIRECVSLTGTNFPAVSTGQENQGRSWGASCTWVRLIHGCLRQTWTGQADLHRTRHALHFIVRRPFTSWQCGTAKVSQASCPNSTLHRTRLEPDQSLDTGTQKSTVTQCCSAMVTPRRLGPQHLPLNADLEASPTS